MIGSHSRLGTLRTRRPKRTFSSTVSQGNNAEPASWKNITRSRPAPVTALPLDVTDPLVAGSKPARILSSVDFPQPEGPSRQKNSPSLISTSMPSSAT